MHRRCQDSKPFPISIIFYFFFFGENASLVKNLSFFSYHFGDMKYNVNSDDIKVLVFLSEYRNKI